MPDAEITKAVDAARERFAADHGGKEQVSVRADDGHGWYRLTWFDYLTPEEQQAYNAMGRALADAAVCR